MVCEELLAGCFFDENAPMALPELNRERRLKYLECCYRQGLSWAGVEQQMEQFLQRKGVTREGIIRQLKKAKPLLHPWLD